jgi:hypothetical protein
MRYPSIIVNRGCGPTLYGSISNISTALDSLIAPDWALSRLGL